MKVQKRDGSLEDMKFDKVTARISNLMQDNTPTIKADKVAQNVFSSMYDGISTHEIDTLSAEISIAMMTEDVAYETLATRIIASNIQKTVRINGGFRDNMKLLHEHGILADAVWELIDTHCIQIEDRLEERRDFDYNYFGLKTLEKTYLYHVGSKLVETPQYMLMRVSIGIHFEDLQSVFKTYDYMSRGLFIHATPTLFNSGTRNPQLSSCFLVSTKEDSLDGIYDTIKECAQISKWAGGIGIHIHNIRAKNSKIRGTNGVSDGIIPMLRVFNATARYVNQSGKRKGSIAVYLEPWHADVMEFLELRLNQGDEESRTRDLFTSLWIPDLFMKRVEQGSTWALMCPDMSPGLSDVYGDEFEELYTRYEKEGKYIKVVNALDVWRAIIKSQSETGTPYMLYKDSCNKKSNQKNVGVIKSSNLCTEIIEYSDKDETAVCNLASVALPKFVSDGFDFKELEETVRIITRNLNRVIDVNYYPTKCAERSNKRHRPIGIGVQGLADVFMMMGYSFDSPAARKLNSAIFETIYYAALSESVNLSIEQGAYSTFEGSPASKGILQFDMWTEKSPVQHCGLYDWNKLRKLITSVGLRNSLFVAPMPTATTSQILGNNECIEPYTTNIYLRRTLAGEFVVVNKHLVSSLQKLGLWSKQMKNDMIAAGGSIQNISSIPDDIKHIYRTVWEIPQKSLIDMAADRGVYIDQSQSLNLFIENPTMTKLSSMHMYAWKSGLKTGIYYLRTKAKSRPIQYTLEPTCVSCSA
jgi:ribonucleoside-diphosphate reductase alpha subunit